MQLLTLTIAERPYGIDTRQVVELLPLVAVRPLPRQPAEVLGLIRYRGRFVPAIDLGQLVGGSRSRDQLGTRTIIVRLGDRLASAGGSPSAGATPNAAGVSRASSPAAADAAAGLPGPPASEPRLLALVAERVIGIAAAAAHPSAAAAGDSPFGPLVDLAETGGTAEAQLLNIDAILPPAELRSLLALAGLPAGAGPESEPTAAATS